jgi:hypothetical protein
MISVSDLTERDHGSRKWVVHRRTRRIIERYGTEVVCLSQKRYRELEREAEHENMVSHPAIDDVNAAIFAGRDGPSFLQELFVRGWRVKKI